MSRASSKTKETLEANRADSVSSLNSDGEEDEVEDESRQETPDLYRNSSLGMYVHLACVKKPFWRMSYVGTEVSVESTFIRTNLQC